MSFGKHSRRNPSGRGGGPPAWFVFLVGTALVLGLYYVWLGVQNFLRTGGLGVVEATQHADVVATATAERIRPTTVAQLPATFTPIPTCEAFVVDVPNAIVREQPNPNGAILTSLFANTEVCVIGRPQPDSEWYTIDSNPRTRRLEVAYMHESVIHAVNPTPTPSITPTPLPTVTPVPTDTPSPSPVPRPTATRDPGITDTPLPTLTPSPTQPVQAA